MVSKGCVIKMTGEVEWAAAEHNTMPARNEQAYSICRAPAPGHAPGWSENCVIAAATLCPYGLKFAPAILEANHFVRKAGRMPGEEVGELDGKKYAAIQGAHTHVAVYGRECRKIV